MRVTAIIPSRSQEHGPLVRCLLSLLEIGDANLRIIASMDGPDAPSDLRPLTRGGAVEVLTGPQGGPGAARNRALDRAEGDLVLYLNDDVVADAGLIDAHRAAHADGAPRLVLGAAPFAVPQDDRVIDRLTRETSLLFFYSEMDDREPERDWGFRHAWTLNLSLPREICDPFDARMRYAMFDDLEWAYRVTRRTGAPVVFRPDAGVVHHHRYEPQGLLAREALLGHQALALRRINPACAAAIFGERFDGSRASMRDARALSTPQAAEAYVEFESLAQRPALSMNVHELFARARAWRWSARGIGYRSAMRGHEPPRHPLALGEGVGA